MIRDQEVDLGWSYSAGNATGFEIDRSTNGTTYGFLADAGPGANTYPDTTVSPLMTYWYRVTPITVLGNSPVSAIVSVTTANPNLPTSPVEDLTAQGASPSDIDLYWVDNTSGATGYVVQRSQNGTNWSTVATLPAGTTTYSDWELQPSETEYYQVLANGYNGLSAASNMATGTTKTAFTPPSVPDDEQTGDFNFDSFTYVGLSSGERSNIFYVGQPVVFTLVDNGGSVNAGVTNLATTYQVRDYDGDLVDSGTVNDTTNILPINVTQQGWYKVYLYGNQSSAEFGNAVGGSTFVIFNNDPNLPSLPAMSIPVGTFPGTPQVTTTSPTVYIFQGNTSFSPVPTIAGSDFSVKWTGQILAPTTGAYTFSTDSDDGIRLWVNGQELINDWVGHAETFDTGTISLTGGQRYNIEVDYYQNQGGAIAELMWAGPNFSQVLVASNNLYTSSAATSPGGLTEQVWGVIGGDEPGIDPVLNAVIEIGPERYQVDDATDPTDAIAQLSSMIDIDEEMYMDYDGVRDPALMIAFPNLDATNQTQLAGVTAISTYFKGEVENYEGLNEPNFEYGGAAYVPIEEAFSKAVKAGDPNANVLGPGIVTLGSYGIGWMSDFFLNGGAQWINGISFHAYNVSNGDLQLLDETMNQFQQMLYSLGLQNMPIWQTEQGYAAANNGLYQPRLQGRWEMLETLVFDQYNIPKEHNFYWYDASQGNWAWPMWLENDDGSLNPAADLMRVFSEEVSGTNYSGAFDFGAEGNNLYVGNMYTGSGRQVAAFMSADQTDGNIELQVTGASTLNIVSAFGVSSTLPVINGYVNLAVPEVPVYVALQSGQSISVVKDNWGADLAMEPGVTVTASNPNNNGTYRINDGIFQDWFWTENDAGVPFQMPYDPNNPATIEMDLPEAQTVDRVVIFSAVPWEAAGALEDFSVQVDENGTWVTVKTVNTNPETFGTWTPVVKTTADQFYSEQANFVVDFAAAQATGIRVVINQVSYGGAGDAMGAAAGGQSNPDPTIDIREIQIFGQ